MESSDKIDYNTEHIIHLMKEESYGAHISLLEQGQDEKGKPIMGIVIESDLPANVLRDILKGLLNSYEQGGKK